MKTTEVRGEDQITESNEPKTSPAVATGSPASSQLLTLIAKQPFFKGLSGPHLQLLADSAMETKFNAGSGFFGKDKGTALKKIRKRTRKTS